MRRSNKESGTTAYESVYDTSFKESVVHWTDHEKIEQVADHLDSFISELNHDEMEELTEHIEMLPEYQSYWRQKIRFDTFDSLLTDLNVARKAGILQMSDDKFDECRRTIKLYATEIKNTARNYTGAVRRMRTMSTSTYNHYGNKTFEQIQRERADQHDLLLKTLASLNQYCQFITKDAKNLIFDSEKFFSADELKERTDIGKWAQDSTIGDTMTEVDQRLHQVLDEKK